MAKPALHRLFYAVLVGDVNGIPLDCKALCVELLRKLVDSISIAVEEGDVRPRLCHAFGHSSTNAASTTCDDGGLALE